MREKPILFSGPMVRAILAGTKTQKRRVMFDQSDDLPPGHCPYQIGDLLWVRETWQHESPHCTDHKCGNPDHVYYRASESSEVVASMTWRPSIFMPRWASRITLQITGIRSERLQWIKSGDAIDEGVGEIQHIWDKMGDTTGMGPKAYKLAFSMLWDEINAKRGYRWESNPWVWAYTFQKVAP